MLNFLIYWEHNIYEREDKSKLMVIRDRRKLIGLSAMPVKASIITAFFSCKEFVKKN